jgi:hypothetical protein
MPYRVRRSATSRSFHPADIGVRTADGLGGLLGGDSARLTQPVQLAAEHQALDSGMRETGGRGWRCELFQQALLRDLTLLLALGLQCAGDRWGAKQDPEGWAHECDVLACPFL